MDKVTIFGAGNVGATTAFFLAISTGLEIALVDVVEGRAKGVALDIQQSLPFAGDGLTSSRLSGGSDPGIVEGSDLVVITAGSPRLPGMSRTDLTSKNAPVIESIALETARLAPDAIILMVTNPVEEMTYTAWQASGVPGRRIMGMAGVLDTSRFIHFLVELAGVDPAGLEVMVLGTHGDDMVPLVDWSTSGGVSLGAALPGDVLGSCVERARDGGAEIVGYLKTGSAYYAPAVSIGAMALAVLEDSGRVLPATAYLEGEYGIEGVFLGVPARLGRGGVLAVEELPLSGRELEGLKKAARGVRERVEALGA